MYFPQNVKIYFCMTTYVSPQQQLTDIYTVNSRDLEGGTSNGE